MFNALVVTTFRGAVIKVEVDVLIDQESEEDLSDCLSPGDSLHAWPDV